MLEIIGITIGIVLAILFIPYLLWRWLVSGNLQKALIHFFTTLQGNDLRVDPEAPIPPSEREPISKVIEQEAEQVKRGTPLGQPVSNPSGIPQASIPATQSDPKPVYEPPYTQNPDTIEHVSGQQQSAQAMPPEIEAPVQPLVEDDTFKVDDPVIDEKHIDPDTPSADTLDASIPELDSSPYGVRFADHSPGRRLRDKRYRRNSS